MREMGIDPWDMGEIDFDPEDPPFGVADDLITTVIEVRADVPAKLASIRSHFNQMDKAFFAGLPDQVAPLVLGQEHYIRAIDRIGAPRPETDLLPGSGEAGKKFGVCIMNPQWFGRARRGS